MSNEVNTKPGSCLYKRIIKGGLFKLICLGMAVSPITLSAQDTLKEPRYSHAIGIGAGFVTGYGISYRYQPSKLGLQVNFAPYKDKETERYSAGLTFFYPLIPGKVASLFLYQGNHYYYDSWTTYYTPDNEESPKPTDDKRRKTDSYVNNGIGIGMELIFAKRIGFNLMMGYGAYVNFTQINVTGETALYFKF